MPAKKKKPAPSRGTPKRGGKQRGRKRKQESESEDEASASEEEEEAESDDSEVSSEKNLENF